MLISALCKYYDTLAKNGLLEKSGYSRVSVRYRILLTPDGRLAAIEPCSETVSAKDKKGNPIKREVPADASYFCDATERRGTEKATGRQRNRDG